jgi:4-carboxymuconolactone decarboxylase
MSSTSEAGAAVLREMAPQLFPAGGDRMQASGFAAQLAEQTMETVFGGLWTRPGLDRRSRSLVTLGMLIAQHAEEELQVHLPIALHNGVTREELEEVVYHATAYAGFPAAATARRVGADIFDRGVEAAHTRAAHAADPAAAEARR